MSIFQLEYYIYTSNLIIPNIWFQTCKSKLICECLTNFRQLVMQNNLIMIYARNYIAIKEYTFERYDGPLRANCSYCERSP